MAKVAIIGTGYVGLTTGACFAHIGHDVICADIDPVRVEKLQRGEIPIVEAGLDTLVAEGIRSGRLTFVLGAEGASADCEFAYLCVPTPQSASGAADLSYIIAAAEQIAAVLPANAVVVNKSTVPVGSTKVVERALNRPEIKTRLRDTGLEVSTIGPGPFGEFIKAEIAKWARDAREAGMQPE